MKRETDYPCSFSLFLSVWNKLQGYQTPDVHFRIAHWLEQSWKNGDKQLVLMAFRSCGKSTLVGLFACWLLLNNPNLRILILAAESILAKKMVANVRRIIERHPLTQGLKPRVPEQWASDRFTVNRTLELRDPSVLACGITGNMTGSRADFIICDDVEVPNTCDTAAKREELRERLSEIDFILTQGGTQLYVGTPHAFETIYKDIPDGDNPKEVPFLKGFRFLRVPVMNERGESAWAEKFTVKALEYLKKKSGPSRFDSQMMLKNVNIRQSRLSLRDFQTYKGQLSYSESQKKSILKLNGVELISVSAYWDPAFGSEKGDGSVVTVLFTGKDEILYVHNVSYIKNSFKGDGDVASEQCQQVCNIIKSNYLPSLTIETNGIGKFLPAILRREIQRNKLNCAVREITNMRPKDLRIVEALDAPLAAKMLYVHENIFDTPFPNEVREWQPGRSGNRDDGLDSLAGAILQESVRFRYQSSTGKRPSWQNKNNPYSAITLIE